MDTKLQDLSQIVAKHNDLIQRARYDLTVSQQRLILFCVSKIKPTDTALNWIDIPILEFCNILDVSPDNWYNNKRIDDMLDALKQTAFMIEKQSGTQTIKKPFQWIYDYRRVKNTKKGNSIGIRLSEDLREYLIELKSNYTTYALYNVLLLRSKHSIRLFELLKSYAGRDIPPTIDIDDLKNLLCCEKYRVNDFLAKILSPAVKEINEKTELTIKYKPIKPGRSVTAIEFKIKQKTTSDIIELTTNTKRRINILSGQAPDQIWLADALRNAQNDNLD